jgi:alkylation response protein AidB-like acyl-CoA dehydrogenase
MSYQPQPQDQAFLLFTVLRAHETLAQLAAFEAVDAPLMAQVMDEAGKFVAQRVAPLNRSGDEVGAQFAQGSVTMPPGFAQTYQDFWQAGWAALSSAPEDGGQGLPEVLNQVLHEWLSAANHGWTMAPGLLHGAYECLKHHASPEVQAQYLEKVGTGQWLATMCLTEPQAGSDLGLCRTKAVSLADGSYGLSGTKIFISGGEHDLSENIVHLVLARIEGAPPGPKGLSLFVTAKYLPGGSRSSAVCERIEEKMGIHGSPTCVMRFDGTPAQLVGEAGKGLAAMFVMMNAARLHVALQGIGLLDAAWQKADAYARERRQMRVAGAPPASRSAGESADIIIEHPAVRRILDTQRAWVDGLRVLAYQTALALDVARHSPEPAQQEKAQRWCSLLTPILKAVATDQGFRGASDCLQVFGGHGYVREWGVEQIVRDARIAMIYEGTNEIQAVDLLVRKVLGDGGMALQALLAQVADEALGNSASATAWQQRRQALWQSTEQLLAAAPHAPELPHWIASDYLRACALLLLQSAWLQVQNALPQLAPAAQSRWQAGAKAFEHWVLPEFDMRLALIAEQIRQASAPKAEHAALV